MAYKGYKDLVVWQKSIKLVSLIYDLGDSLPKHEQFILLAQMLRSAISIPSNIAEGWSRNRTAEFIRFLEIAYTSSCELETQLIICQARYAKTDCQTAMNLLIEVQKMLSKLIQNRKNA